MLKNTIMIIDDDLDIRVIIRTFLEMESYEVVDFSNARLALENINTDISLIILDVSMPEMNGIEFCRELRKKYNIPVLFLTARTQEQDIVLGLSVGGDDYLTKPFTQAELIARVKALIRRYKHYTMAEARESQIIKIDHLVIDALNKTVTSDNEVINLSDREFQILLLLAKNQSTIFSIPDLYESIWEETYYSDSANTVMVHIRKLRKKIESDSNNPKIVKNVWGRGYRIDARD